MIWKEKEGVRAYAIRIDDGEMVTCRAEYQSLKEQFVAGHRCRVRRLSESGSIDFPFLLETGRRSGV